MIRTHVHYSGDVQGVGFRYAAARLAGARPVAGFVRNLPDGRVELVVEGEAADVEGLLESIRGRMGRHIRRESVADEPATGEFDAFEVAF